MPAAAVIIALSVLSFFAASLRVVLAVSGRVSVFFVAALVFQVFTVGLALGLLLAAV